jgi:two-component system, chemotaxis family, sensor kinase CheA
VKLRRFLDLYAAETQEHLRLLNRGILDLESVDAARATDEAFRAAHTIKGLSAAMGYGGVTALAHDLEDRLTEVRAGRLQPDETLVDELLASADALESAIALAIETGPDAVPDAFAEDAADLAANASTTPPPTAAGRISATELPPAGRGDERAVRVRLRADSPLMAARATLVVKAAERVGELRTHEPAAFDDAFDGVMTLVFGPAVSEAAAEAAIRSAGDVESVTWAPRSTVQPAPSSPVQPAPSPPVQPAPPRKLVQAGGAEAVPPARTSQMRVDPRRLDQLAEGIGEAAVLHARLQQAARVLEPAVSDMVDRLGTLVSELQRTILAMRMVPVSEVFDRFPRLVRDAARAVGKQVEFRIEGADIELDRAILEEMIDPLVHLLRNAVDHGLESAERRVAGGKAERGTLLLRAERERSSVLLQVADDGGGIDAARIVAGAKAAGIVAADARDDIGSDELLRLLSQPGFSTAREVTALSGRGVGMDAVVARIRSVGGAITLDTRPGAGTTFTLRLPLTLALVQALRVRVSGEDYAIPLTHVTEAVELADVMVVGLHGRESLRLRNELLPLVRLRTVLKASAIGEETAAVIAEIGERRAALAVDELVGREQILVKSFDAAVGMLPHFSGATLLADGRPALILDPLSVL